MIPKVGFVTGLLAKTGGAERQLALLAELLLDSGTAPVLINLNPTNCTPGHPDGAYSQLRALTRQGISVLPIDPTASKVSKVRRISQILVKHKCDVVHGWHRYANPFAGLAGLIAGVPVRFGSMREAYYDAPARTRFPETFGVNGLTANSLATVASAKRARDIQMVFHAPNAIALPDLSATDKSKTLATELGIDISRINFAMIGRMDANKNQVMALKALATVPTPKRAQLHLFGDGPERQRLELLSREFGIAGTTFFHGRIQGVRHLLPLFAGFLHTAIQEGAPNAVLESMAAGLPVVSTPCGDVTRIIDHGTRGYVVRLNDHLTMARWITEISDNPNTKEQIGKKAREYVASRHCPRQCLEALLNAYERCPRTLRIR